MQVEELNLDSCDATQITGLTDQYTSLETLTLSNNGLTSLKGFPNLPNLRKVIDSCIESLKHDCNRNLVYIACVAIVCIM